jgi:predicted esterase
MPTALISLHGFTMNAAGLKHMMAPLEARLAGTVDCVYPDAPHTAPEASVAGLAQLLGGFRPKPPNLQWWSATDDGSQYAGWDATRAHLTAELAAHPDAGLLGFSQGAAVAAALAAASSQGLIPPLRFVVAIAGFIPRAHTIAPLFDVPVRIPSLHVWGLGDGMAKQAQRLTERFDPEQREIVTWAGRHIVPTSGEAADAIVDLVQRHASC